MQCKRTARCIVWTLLVVYLLCMSTAAMGTLTPLDEVQDEYYYYADFGDTGFTISIPVRYGKRGMLVDDADIKQLLFMEENKEAPCFTITGIRSDSFLAMNAAKLSWEDMLPAFEEILEDIQAQPLLLDMELEADESALEALLVLFPGDENIWHIAGLRDDWLLVLTLHPQEGDEAAIELARGKMEELAQHMLLPSFQFDVVQQIMPENSSICMTLPEGMEAVVDPYDEYGMTVYYLREAATPYVTSLIYVTAAYREAFIGKTIEQLTGDQLNEAVEIIFTGLGESWNDWLPLGEMIGLWLVEETTPGYGLSHLICLKEGWLIAVTTMYVNPEAAMSREEMTTIQLSMMQNLVRGSAEPASRGPESITLQGEKGVFEIAVPHGHLVYQHADGDDYTNYLIINVLNINESYLVAMLRREDPQIATMPERPEDISAFAENLGAAMGVALSTHELVEEGILGETTLLFYTEAEDRIVAVTHLDGMQVVLGITVPDMPENSKAIMDIGNGFVSYHADD